MENPGVTLLFAADQRPGGAAIARLARDRLTFSISLDSDATLSGYSGPAKLSWLELLSNGLTFDLLGLSEGPGAPIPVLRHAYALAKDIDLGELSGVALVPGPHLGDGALMTPVLRGLAGLAAELALLDGACAICWQPSGCWSEPTFFRTAVGRWIEGGAFPTFALAALDLTEGGAMQSDGLAIFTGQELRIEPELVVDPSSAGKLGLRLLDYLVNHGTLRDAEGVVAPDGTGLRLEPSGDGRFVRVWRA